MIGIVVKQTGLASDEDIDGRGGRLVGAVEQQSISAHHHHDSWLLIQLLQTTTKKKNHRSFLILKPPPHFFFGFYFPPPFSYTAINSLLSASAIQQNLGKGGL